MPYGQPPALKDDIAFPSHAQGSSFSNFMMSGVSRRLWSNPNNCPQLAERLVQPVSSDKQQRNQSCQTLMF
jgi:hypothetical protein